MKWQTYPAFLVCGHMHLFNSLIKPVLIISVWIAQFRTRAAIHVENNIKSACFGSAQLISWYSVQRDFYLGKLEYWKVMYVHEKGTAVWSQPAASARLFKQTAAHSPPHTQIDLGAFYMGYVHWKYFWENLCYFETSNFHLTLQPLFINVKLQNNLGHFAVTRAIKRIFCRTFSKRLLILWRWE